MSDTAPKTDRLPPIPPAAWSEEQRRAAADFEALRGTKVFGPFVPLMRSPELMLRFQRVGEFCRYRTSLPLNLSEFAILLVARRHSNDVEWAIHAPIAADAGVKETTITALSEGRRPSGMTADETLVHEAIEELWRANGWSDPTWSAVTKRFGEAGAVELVGLVGYYATIAMVMNVARTAAPAGPRLPRLP